MFFPSTFSFLKTKFELNKDKREREIYLSMLLLLFNKSLCKQWSIERVLEIENEKGSLCCCLLVLGALISFYLPPIVIDFMDHKSRC